MIEHPVPQHVTGYQFHLVGDMTLKQFLELAGGIVAAWFIWSLEIPSLIRWPFAVLAAVTGFALAFMPLEERPLDQWIISFFKSVYRPTLLVWKKTPPHDFLQFTPRPTDTQIAAALAKSPSANLTTLLEAYQLAGEAETETDPLEKDWQENQTKINKLFASVKVPPKLALETTFPQKLPSPDTGRQAPDTTLHPLSLPDNPTAVLRGEITLPSRIPAIPVTPPTPVQKTRKPQAAKPPAGLMASDAHLETLRTSGTPSITSVFKTQPPSTTATLNPSLPMPTTPDQPNILSGMVLTSDGQIVENAIIEIRRLTDRLPVRAVKTNKLGQFTIATPLPPGNYELEIEKDHLSFDILKIKVQDKIIQPIEIRAKGNKKQ